MGKFERNRAISRVRFARQIELLDLINAGVQTNASLTAFAGANTASTKMKRITDKEEAILAESSVMFGGRGTRFYRMRDNALDYIDAKENNAISHAVYFLRELDYLVDIVKPFSLEENAVKYRTLAVVNDKSVSELVFSYFDSSKANVDYTRKFYNFDDEIGRVIVFDDVISYRRFLRNTKKDESLNKIKDQLHIVLDSAQSTVKASNFNLVAFSINDKGHVNINRDNIYAFLDKFTVEDADTVMTIKRDYSKAERNAAKFEKNIES